MVFTTWGSFGDLHPFVALALELQARGYDSVIATAPLYRDKIEAEGIGFYPVRPDLPPPDSDASAELIRRVSNARWGPGYLFRKLLIPHLRETYADTVAAVTADGGADLLVSHQIPLTARLVAEKKGIKWISAVLFPIAFASAYDPPTPPQLPALQKRLSLVFLSTIGKMVSSQWPTCCVFWTKASRRSCSRLVHR